MFDFELYIAVSILLNIFYIVFLAPLLFKFWIIPKIEDRYGRWLRIENVDAFPYCFMIGARWGMPCLEISAYIVFKYFGGTPRKNADQHLLDYSLYRKLDSMNYDINKASRAEIIMSFITVFSMLSLIFCSIYVFLITKVFT